MRVDIGGDPKEPWLNIAWKYLWTAKDTWLGSDAGSGFDSARSTTSPWIHYEKYDMIFNGALATRMPVQLAGKYAGQDNGWAAGAVLPMRSSTSTSRS